LHPWHHPPPRKSQLPLQPQFLKLPRKSPKALLRPNLNKPLK
jgi:hypothetical protein